MPETCSTCGSTCGSGPCRTPQACLMPIELHPIRRRIFTNRPSWLPSTQEAWGRVIGAALGLGGFLLFAHALAQRFHWS